MTVIVLTACPERLRGYLTRWLLEIAAGVYVGHVSRRVRDELWERVNELVGRGRGLMVFSGANEQHLEIRTCGHDWIPADVEGITLMRRPALEREPNGPGYHAGWSSVAGRRKASGRRK